MEPSSPSNRGKWQAELVTQAKRHRLGRWVIFARSTFLSLEVFGQSLYSSWDRNDTLLLDGSYHPHRLGCILSKRHTPSRAVAWLCRSWMLTGSRNGHLLSSSTSQIPEISSSSITRDHDATGATSTTSPAGPARNHTACEDAEALPSMEGWRRSRTRLPGRPRWRLSWRSRRSRLRDIQALLGADAAHHFGRGHSRLSTRRGKMSAGTCGATRSA